MLALFILLGLLLIHTWFGPDIWYHLNWGRSLWEKQSLLPDVRTLIPQPLEANPYWLFQLVNYGLYSVGGVILVSLVFMAIWLLIAWLWVRITQAHKSSFLGLLFFLVFILLSQQRFEARPEIWSYLFLLLTLWLLLRRKPGQAARWPELLSLFVIQAVWLNSHSYFIFGLAVTVLSGSVRSAIVSAAACLLSPFGPYLWISLWNYVQFGPQMKDVIHELMPPAFTWHYPMGIFWIYLAFVSGFSVWIASQSLRAKKLVTPFLLSKILWAGMGAVVAVQAARNIPLFLILSAPLLADLLAQVKIWLDKRSRWRPFYNQALSYTVMAMAVTLSVFVYSGQFHRWTYSMGRFGFGLEKAAFPVEAVEYLKSISFEGNLFTDSYDGGYVQFMMPKIKVAGDSYFADADETLKYFAAIRNPQALDELNRRLSFDALLINIENVDGLQSFMSNKVWRMVYADSHRVLFVNHGRFEQAQFSLEKTKLYDGGDLRHWVYAYGVNTWAGLAYSRQDAALMENLIAELLEAKAIPSTALRFVLQLGIIQKNQKIISSGLALSGRVYESEPGEMERLNTLLASAAALQVR